MKGSTNHVVAFGQPTRLALFSICPRDVAVAPKLKGEHGFLFYFLHFGILTFSYRACLVEFLDGDGPLEERFAALTGLHVVVPACRLGRTHLAGGLRLVSLRLPL